MAGLQTRNRVQASGVGNRERLDATVWMVLVAAGLLITVLAVALGAQLGTDAPPFLLGYQLEASPGLVAPLLVIVGVLWTVRRRFAVRCHWPSLLALSYVGAFAWLVALSLPHGADGLTRYVRDADGYTPPVNAGSISEILTSLAQPDGHASTAVTGHPPGPAVLLWLLRWLPLSDTAIALVWTALAAATVPLVLLVGTERV